MTTSLEALSPVAFSGVEADILVCNIWIRGVFQLLAGIPWEIWPVSAVVTGGPTTRWFRHRHPSLSSRRSFSRRRTSLRSRRARRKAFADVEKRRLWCRPVEGRRTGFEHLDGVVAPGFKTFQRTRPFLVVHA